MRYARDLRYYLVYRYKNKKKETIRSPYRLKFKFTAQVRQHAPQDPQ